jgi:TetR/AcrR family transcriptional repressor of nem operon
MVIETELRGRGRPRQFDPDQVLDQLVDLFWEKGYAATSMSDIVEATGLNKSSLYNSFGSKEEMFELAIDHYLSMRSAALHGVRDGTSGLEDVFAFIDAVHQEATGPNRSRGCMAVNSTTELGNRDEAMVAASARFRDELRTSVSAALKRAATAGEIDGEEVGHHAETLVSFMLSLAVIARGGAGKPELEDQFAAIRSVIDSWRTAG